MWGNTGFECSIYQSSYLSFPALAALLDKHYDKHYDGRVGRGGGGLLFQFCPWNDRMFMLGNVTCHTCSPVPCPCGGGHVFLHTVVAHAYGVYPAQAVAVGKPFKLIGSDLPG